MDAEGKPEKSQADRKLAAIMFTDMVGYTALSQTDEALALEVLKKHNQLLRPFFPKYHGSEIKTIGDSFLIEFDSALDATICAIEIQKFLHDYNISAREDWRIKLRIGIHLGDVVHQRNDIFGDAVNIASRIQQLANPEGVCVSQQVFDQIHNKVSYELDKLGQAELKNVKFQTNVYSVVLPWETRASNTNEKARKELDKLRVAVLPFSNISPDSADEYFADGLTEELISKLSLVGGLRVIARTSIMSYKNKEKKISEIGTELGVGTVVEGSVRKAGNRIRVTAQLIDVGSEEHLWASSYDKNLDDIFAVQTDIASKIAESLPGSLSTKFSNLSRGETGDPKAYSLYLKAKQLRNLGTGDSLRQALELFTDATKIDPSFARAYVEIGNCYAWLGIKDYISYDEGVHGMKAAASKALEIDDGLAEAHALLSFIGFVEDDFAKMGGEARRAIELNPNLADAHLRLAMDRGTIGYPKEWLRYAETAHLLDPLSSEIIDNLGNAYYYLGREKEALDFWEGNRKFAPFVVARSLADYHIAKKDYDAADREIRLLEALAPDEAATIVERGISLAARGDSGGASNLIEKLEKRFKGGPGTDRNIGYIKYFLGDMDAFFAAMFRSVEEHVFNPIKIRYSPLFEKARQDARYSQLLRKNGLDPELKEQLR